MGFGLKARAHNALDPKHGELCPTSKLLSAPREIPSGGQRPIRFNRVSLNQSARAVAASRALDKRTVVDYGERPEAVRRYSLPVRSRAVLANDPTPPDILIAFSRKGYGGCLSCNCRRMAEAAAHLTDRILPDPSVRQ